LNLGQRSKVLAELEQFIETETQAMLGGDVAELVQAFRTLLRPVDAAVFTDKLGAFILGRVREGIRASRAGWVYDDLAFVRPWDFDLDQMRVPVLLLQGGQDRMVPFAHGRWLAALIPGAEARFQPDDDHLTLSARRVPEVHVWLLSKW
jgi:pimeloyl-ACP methyl ester carboxylesterase